MNFPFRKKIKNWSFEEKIDSRIRTVQRMTSEQLASLIPLKKICMKYKDCISYVDMSIVSHTIGITEGVDCSQRCELQKEIADLGYKVEEKNYDGRKYLNVQCMRYLGYGERD